MTRFSAIIVLFTITLTPLCAQDWTKESKDRAKRTALHDAAQLVRGDSGKWNDNTQLFHGPSLGPKAAKMSLDVWVDQSQKKKSQATDKDDNWLVLRTGQLDDNDRIWIERIERRGKQFTVVANLAKWQGKYFRNFTGYEVIGVNLGKLEPGAYDAKLILQPLVFTKFDGDGKALTTNWPKDERPADQKPAELRLSFSVRAKPGER